MHNGEPIDDVGINDSFKNWLQKQTTTYAILFKNILNTYVQIHNTTLYTTTMTRKKQRGIRNKSIDNDYINTLLNKYKHYNNKNYCLN